MAIACLRLVTFLPLRPLLSVPRFLRRIADFTVLPAPLLYLAITSSLATTVGPPPGGARVGTPLTSGGSKLRAHEIAEPRRRRVRRRRGRRACGPGPRRGA